MDRDRTITAYFTGCEGPYDITVAATTYLHGSTTINASFGIVTCSATQTSEGTVVNVTAVAAEGYRFDGWKGGITGSQGNMSFVANSTEAITAEFSESSQPLWIWVVVGIATLLMVGSLLLMVGPLIYSATFGRAKKVEDHQPQPNVEQEIAP